MSRVATMALAGLAVVLAVVVGLELRPRTRDDTGMGDSVRVTAPAATAATAAAPADDGARWAAVMLTRPLFAPGRRPVAASAAAAPAALPRIAGILRDGGVRRVIFAAAAGGRPAVVAEGGEVNGFRVQAIEDDRVTILGPDGSRVLRPSFDPKPPEPASAAPGLPGLPGLGIGIPGLTVPGPSAR